jgi:hypothetical protein
LVGHCLCGVILAAAAINIRVYPLWQSAFNRRLWRGESRACSGSDRPRRTLLAAGGGTSRRVRRAGNGILFALGARAPWWATAWWRTGVWFTGMTILDVRVDITMARHYVLM